MIVCVVISALVSLAIVAIPWIYYLLSTSRHVREHQSIEAARTRLERLWEKENAK